MRTSGISDHLERWNYSLLFCQVVKGKVPWPRSRKALGAPESSDNFNTMLMIGSQRVNGIFVCIKLLKNRNMTKKSQETFRSVQFLFINSWMGGANSQLKRSNIVESYQKESKKRHFRDLLWTAFHLCISSVKELLECARRKSGGPAKWFTSNFTENIIPHKSGFGVWNCKQKCICKLYKHNLLDTQSYMWHVCGKTKRLYILICSEFATYH